MNKKGFTLIEIIVVLAVISIIVGIAGSMMISAFKEVYNANVDLERRIVHSVIDVVREDTQYATDVRLIQPDERNDELFKEEDDWHFIYVKNGVLYRDDEPLFPSSFYKDKTIYLVAKGDYQNGVRVDFEYYLKDENGKNVYSTRDTIMYINVQVSDDLKNGLYDQTSKASMNADDEVYYILYYRKNLLHVND